MASARSASLNGGLGAEHPAGSRAEPLVGGQGGLCPLKLKAFCTFLYKKWPKVKDVGENLSPCLTRAAMTSPMFWSMGGGRPPGPPIAGSATALLHHLAKAISILHRKLQWKNKRGNISMYSCHLSAYRKSCVITASCARTRTRKPRSRQRSTRNCGWTRRGKASSRTAIQ